MSGNHDSSVVLAAIAKFSQHGALCPAAPTGCSFEGVVIVGENCYCVYRCGESVFFTPCP